MKTSTPALVLGLILATLSASQTFACGDKYLSIGRGARFQRGYVSLRPASVAILKNEVTTNKHFLARLKLAGHRVTVAADVQELSGLLARTKVDVVLANYSDASTVSRALHAVETAPLFLPVVESSSVSAPAAHKEYGCLLNGDPKAKRSNFLAVLDEALESNRKSKPVQCDLTRL